MRSLGPRLLLLAVLPGLTLATCAHGSRTQPAPRELKRPPVVMLAFDELPADTLTGPDGQIDRGRFPNFAALADSSTWYPNATTVADWSWRALPAILTGRRPRASTRSGDEARRRNLFRLLARHGYRVHGSEEVTSICTYRGCRSARERRFASIVGRGRFERLRRSIDSIHGSARPTFTFHDAILPHQPWVFLPSGLRHQSGVGDFPLGVTGPPGFHDRSLAEHTQQRYLLQLGAVDRALGRLFRRLRAEDIYDETLIVVTADHGIATDVGVHDRRKVSRANIDEVAVVPLFIKASGQTHGAVDRSYIRTVDILPTVASLLRVRVPWPVDGHRAGSPDVQKRRVVRLVRRDYRGTMAIDATELARRRAENRLKRVRTFGSGSWESVYRIGPNPELLGRSPSEFAHEGAGALRARLRDPELLLDVRSHSGLVPSSIGGLILGGKSRAVRELAIAVNGRIVGLGRSFHLDDRRGERLSVMVPENSLREGRNEVQVFAVDASQSPRLTLIGHVG